MIWHRDIRDVLHDVNEFWDLTGPLPVPRDDKIRCPVCSGEPTPRYWQPHEVAKEHKWRIDVSFKCSACSLVWLHGVVVSQEYYDRCPGRKIMKDEAYRMLHR